MLSGLGVLTDKEDVKDVEVKRIVGGVIVVIELKKKEQVGRVLERKMKLRGTRIFVDKHMDVNERRKAREERERKRRGRNGGWMNRRIGRTGNGWNGWNGENGGIYGMRRSWERNYGWR